MEKKIESLRNSIKANPNLSEEFKCNLGTLTDTMVTVFPDYDYSNYERVLGSLNLTIGNELNSYSNYNKETNTVKFNLKKVFDDRIDLQHLFLNNLVRMGSGVMEVNPELEGFITGLTEVISSTMNNDESMKKLNVLENIGMNIFSKIVSPETLLNAYMMGDMGSVVVELEGLGIEKEEFTKLLGAFNNMKSGNGFTDAECLMINMFSKVVDSKLKSGVITEEEISSEYDDFSDMLIYSKSELISMYPHHDFSSLTGFENVKKTLDEVIVNTETKEVEFVK